jgi:hypothetical protein
MKNGVYVFIPHIHKLFKMEVDPSFPKPLVQRLITSMFKSWDKKPPSICKTIMINSIVAKSCGIILENKINIWLESQGKRDKGQVVLGSYNSTMGYLVTLMIITEEC